MASRCYSPKHAHLWNGGTRGQSHFPRPPLNGCHNCCCTGGPGTSTHSPNWKGKQAEEVLLLLRKLMRTAEDWRIQYWVVKLDIRKAFDSVLQESLKTMVGHWVGEKGGVPWEPCLAQPAPSTAGQCGGGGVGGRHSANHGRQARSAGLTRIVFGPHRESAATMSPVHRHIPGSVRQPPLPDSRGAFMDDTYLWDDCPQRLQRHITAFAGQLKRDGLEIHGKKVAILTNGEETRKFQVGGGPGSNPGGQMTPSPCWDPQSHSGGWRTSWGGDGGASETSLLGQKRRVHGRSAA